MVNLMPIRQGYIGALCKKSLGCNRVAVKDASLSSISSHHSALEESMKDESLKQMFQMMYQNNFNERNIIKLQGHDGADITKVTLSRYHKKTSNSTKYSKQRQQGLANIMLFLFFSRTTAWKQ